MSMAQKKTMLALRREALIVQCSLQRIEAAREFAALRTPVSMLTGGSGIGQYLSMSKLKVPLGIAGVVLGMFATKAGRFVPLATAALSLFKVVRTVLPMLRKRAD